MPVAKPKIARAKSKDSDSVTTFAVIGALLAGLVGVAYYFFYSHVKAISVADAAALKQVFKSGEPWLIECVKPGKGPSPVFSDAWGSLTSGAKLATLDCNAQLPSGKSTYERFKLRQPNYGPVILVTANTERPQMVPKNVLSSGAAIAKWASSITKAKLYPLSAASQFDGQCVRKSWCLVALTATGRLNDAEKKAMKTIVEAERGLRVVKIDASKHNLLLDLPGGAVSAPDPKGEAMLLLLRESDTIEAPAASADDDAPAEGEDDGEGESSSGSGKAVIATHLSTGLLGDLSATRKAIRAALSSSEEMPSGFNLLPKRPSLREKRKPPPPPPKYEASSNPPSTPDPKSKTYTDAELKAIREERAAKLKEAELQRRQKMAEEEASAANIVEEVDDDEPSGGGAGGAAALEADDDDDDDPAAAADEEVEAEEFD